MSSIRNCIYELPHELLNDLSRILGNNEISGKSQTYMGTQPRAQAPPAEINV